MALIFKTSFTSVISFSSTMRRPVRSKNRLSVMSVQSVSTVSSEDGVANAAALPDLPITRQFELGFSRQSSLEVCEASSDEEEDDTTANLSTRTVLDTGSSLNNTNTMLSLEERSSLSNSYAIVDQPRALNGQDANDNSQPASLNLIPE